MKQDWTPKSIEDNPGVYLRIPEELKWQKKEIVRFCMPSKQADSRKSVQMFHVAKKKS